MKLLLLAVAGIIVFSCKEDDFQNQTKDQPYGNREAMVDIDYRGQKLLAWKNNEGDYIVGDDIILFRNEVRELSTHDKANKFFLKIGIRLLILM
ncbi:hypothetical protein OWR28_14615 [Chryseobacterium sp. 1B4]